MGPSVGPLNRLIRCLDLPLGVLQRMRPFGWKSGSEYFQQFPGLAGLFRPDLGGQIGRIVQVDLSRELETYVSGGRTTGR